MAVRTPFLMPNEQLTVGQLIQSPDGRFQFGITRDTTSKCEMQLLCFEVSQQDSSKSDAFALTPQQPFYHGDISPQAYLVMNAEAGRLWLIDPATGPILDRDKPKWFSFDPRHPGTYPNAYLVLQSDGNLVIYKEGGSTSRDSIWANDTVQSPQQLGKLVHPNYPSLNIKNGRLGATGSLAISNQWECEIAVHDGLTYMQLPPGKVTPIERLAGTLAIEPTQYENPLASSDVTETPITQFSPCEVPARARQVTFDSEGFHID